MIKLTAFVTVVVLFCLNQIAYAQHQGGLVMSNCSDEIKLYCSHVQHGMGRVPACLEKHSDKLSDQCKKALETRKGMISR